MNRLSKLLTLTATAVATSLLLAACGGGDATPPPGPSNINGGTTAPPPDTTVPSVTIFDDTPAASATGPVTFTFIFNKDVGASFAASDVVVTGGTAGAFSKVSGTQATLVVTPIANTAGTINVSVAAGTFSDLAGNSNTAAASAEQAYNSVVLTQMSLPVSFDAAGVGYGLVGFGGAEDSTVAADPTDATNHVARVVRAAGSESYAGTTITATSAAGVQTGFTPKIPFNVTDTRMTVRVWSPDAGIPVRLKVEDSADPNKSVETEATVTTAAGWQTLTFNFANQATGTSALNVAYNYNKATIFFDFGRAKAAAVQKTYYFDDLSFLAGAAGGGGGSCGTTTPTCAPTTAIPAGSTVIYSDASSITGLDTKPDWGQSPAVVFSEPTIAGNKSLKYTFGGTALYEGIDWSGNPQNVSTKTTLHLDFFSADINSVKVSIISAGKENAVTRAITAGSWNAIDIDLALYTVPEKTAIIQIKLEPATAGTLYVDNIYFHGAAAGVSCGTTAPTCAPSTVIPSGSTVIYSDAASVTGIDKKPDWGQSPAVVFSEPTIAGNASLKYTFGGTALYEGIDWAGNPQNVSTKGTLHLDVWSADVSSLKISLIGGGAENGITKPLTAGSWNSIDIDMAQYSSPDKTRIIQMKLEPGTVGTIYVDNIHFYGTASGGGGGGSGTFSGGIFSSDYSGNLGAGTAVSDKGGSVGFFVDPRLYAVRIFEDGSVCGSACNPGGVFNFYYGIGKPATPTYADAYFGAYVNAPGNTSADASAFAKVKLKFWGDAESWEKTNFTAQVDVILQGPANAACTNPSGRPEMSKTVTAQKIGAGSDYTILKTDFALTQSCGGTYTANSVWSAVGSVVVRLAGSSNLNYVNLTPSTPPSYPTFINVGPISFTN
ncbi:MAG: Ig-like domain-containing protein [Burkholderiaceae bacterium]